MADRPRRLRWLLPALVALVWLAAAGPLNLLGGKLSGLQENDNAAFLPDSAESTRVGELQRGFSTQDTLPALIVWEAPGGITPEVSSAVTAKVAEISRAASASGGLVGQVSPPIPSADGKALEMVVPLRPDLGDELVPLVDELRRVVDVPGANAYVTGPGGIFADFANGFSGIDGLLLLAAFGVVLLILLAVYRSPILPLLVILTAVLALSAGTAVAYLLADAGWIKVNGQSQGISSILVVGAATDYGLLLAARYREELRRTESRYQAMRIALHRAFEPIVASGATVILGVLCLLLSDLGSNRGLGPISAVNVVFAMVAALTFLPAALTVLGRAAFWPVRPRYGSEERDGGGLWGRVAGLVGRRPGPVLAVTVLILLAASAFLPTLKADGLSTSDIIRGPSEGIDGQEVLARHFDAGTGSPAVVIAPEDAWRQYSQFVSGLPGVASVAPVGDGPPGAPAGPGRPVAPKVVDGRVELSVVLRDEADSDAAIDTVRTMREIAARETPGVLVGGTTAANLDVRETTDRDLVVIVPVVLLTTTLVLALLLRSLVAPLLLLGTVVLSFAATLGVTALAFNHLFRFPGSDRGLILIAFVFLIALGIDYNIFLMTRAREESARSGTKTGILTALTVTGGVITSAGLVLAATFGALTVLPILFLTQVAFIVAFGVMLDTFVVRSLVVPAAVWLLGDRVWWPSRLARGPRPPEPEPATRAPDPDPAGSRSA
jgi:RND superfamily putative drug exporter